MPKRNEMQYVSGVLDNLDLSHPGEYMQAKHGISVASANDAVADVNRVVVSPDYNGASGQSVRIVGHSMLAEALISVIAMSDGGIGYGVKGWRRTKWTSTSTGRRQQMGKIEGSA